MIACDCRSEAIQI